MLLTRLMEDTMTNKNTICLWYDGTAADAAQFYADTVPDSAVERPFGPRGTTRTVTRATPSQWSSRCAASPASA